MNKCIMGICHRHPTTQSYTNWEEKNQFNFCMLLTTTRLFPFSITHGNKVLCESTTKTPKIPKSMVNYHQIQFLLDSCLSCLIRLTKSFLPQNHIDFMLNGSCLINISVLVYSTWAQYPPNASALKLIMLTSRNVLWSENMRTTFTSSLAHS